MPGGPAALPRPFEPELATLVDAPPSGDDWFHEIKLDGYRLLCAAGSGSAVKLWSRRLLDWTERLPRLASAIGALSLRGTLLDGELVWLDDRGVSDFQSLQNSIGEGSERRHFYYVFDVLVLGRRDVRGEPLSTRKELLAPLFGLSPQKGMVRLSEHVVGHGPKFLSKACELGLEGIVSKRAGSRYVSGRTRDWLKTKCSQEQEFVIGGFTEPEGSRSELGALVVGFYEDRKLVYAGKVGTGFTRKSLLDLRRRLEPLEQKGPAFVNPPRGADARGVHWVLPKLIAEVKFTGFTSDGRLRHPSFQGLREDKRPEDVGREIPTRVSPRRSPKPR